jgi:hypothetical protein
LGKALFYTACHHACGVLSLAVQRDHRMQRSRLARRAGDGPIR